MTPTSNLLDPQPLSKKWDTESLAIIGAFSGLIAGSAFEIGEVFFQHPNNIEPFLEIMSEVGVASLAGFLMFSVASTIRNRLN